MIIGVDIGGTFTDIVLQDDTGALHIHKLLSSPSDPSQAMLQGLRDVTANDLHRLQRVAHGSTVATNAILERKGAQTALITTQGFADILQIARQQRPYLYALHPQVTPPLIPRELIFEVDERLDVQGNVITKLTKKSIDAVIKQLKASGVESVAVCLLHSYINAEHEQLIRERLLEKTTLQAWQIALSSEVLPEFREYERTTTTALEAYLRPVMAQYVTSLRDKLPDTTTLHIMKSDGGVMDASYITSRAAQTALSGPAAGVIGAHYIAKLAGYNDIITLDMGGTSTDVALVPSEIVLSANAEIDGLPLRLRLLDIETIGAGGGSIVRFDSGGAVRVGPESAGADPGPIIYGQGGNELTVSDANALLGRIPPDQFLGGKMALQLEAAQAKLNAFADQAHLAPFDLAQGIVDITNANIERALRRVSVERGHDPRDFTLVAFGGAGPLHACAVAERLDIQRVLIPQYPGVLCALGLLVADISVEAILPVMERIEYMTIPRLRAQQGRVMAAGKQELNQQGSDSEQMEHEIYLDMRYVGQAYELSIPFYKTVITDFHTAHQAKYGHRMSGDYPIEIVSMRMKATVPVDKPILTASPMTHASPQSAVLSQFTSPLGEHITLYDRAKLQAGTQFNGASIITQLDSTVYIPEGWRATVDAYHNLLLEAIP